MTARPPLALAAASLAAIWLGWDDTAWFFGGLAIICAAFFVATLLVDCAINACVTVATYIQGDAFDTLPEGGWLDEKRETWR